MFRRSASAPARSPPRTTRRPRRSAISSPRLPPKRKRGPISRPSGSARSRRAGPTSTSPCCARWRRRPGTGRDCRTRATRSSGFQPVNPLLVHAGIVAPLLMFLASAGFRTTARAGWREGRRRHRPAAGHRSPATRRAGRSRGTGVMTMRSRGLVVSILAVVTAAVFGVRPGRWGYAPARQRLRRGDRGARRARGRRACHRAAGRRGRSPQRRRRHRASRHRRRRAHQATARRRTATRPTAQLRLLLAGVPRGGHPSGTRAGGVGRGRHQRRHRRAAVGRSGPPAFRGAASGQLRVAQAARRRGHAP